MDPIDRHLLGYGFGDLAPDPMVYEVALPRLLERFAHAGVRGTFFVVARDAEWQREALARVTTGGHEIASHSLTHPLALSRLPAERLRDELAESRRLLEAVTAAPVVGFRAPNFDVSRAVLSGLGAAGYRYDASSYPSPMLLPARMMLALQSRDPAAVLGMTPWPWSMRRAPHRLPAAAGALIEFPISVTPVARLPVYHTMRYFTGPEGFGATLDGFVRRGESLSYVLHAVDVLGLEEDGVDPRLRRHPGMRVAKSDKLRLLDETLAAIHSRFEVVPFRDRLHEPL